MDIRFDYRGVPNGGCILNYLLEKSRIVMQSKSERNFHIFYQILNGCNEDMLTNELNLVRDVTKYSYLNNEFEILSYNGKMNEINDKENFDLMFDALLSCDFNQNEQINLFKVISAILNLGNIKFKIDHTTNGKPKLVRPDVIILNDKNSEIALENFCKVDFNKNKIYIQNKFISVFLDA
jgi:myosin-1